MTGWIYVNIIISNDSCIPGYSKRLFLILCPSWRPLNLSKGHWVTLPKRSPRIARYIHINIYIYILYIHHKLYLIWSSFGVTYILSWFVSSHVHSQFCLPAYVTLNQPIAEHQCGLRFRTPGCQPKPGGPVPWGRTRPTNPIPGGKSFLPMGTQVSFIFWGGYNFITHIFGGM